MPSQLSFCRLNWLPFQKIEAVFQCFLSFFLVSFQDFGEFACTHYPWENPVKFLFMVVLFYLRKKALPQPSSKDLHMLFISLRAVVQIFYMKVCRLFLAFFYLRKRVTIFLVLIISEERKIITRQGLGGPTPGDVSENPPTGVLCSQSSVQYTRVF